MPELQPAPASSAGRPPDPQEAAALAADCDFALGCECADPMLHIEPWRQEMAAALAAAEPHH